MSVKESILEAGIALLESKGIAALTQPQVASAAGIKQSHLTYYFPTRTDLLTAIADRWVTQAMDALSVRVGKKPAFATLAKVWLCCLSASCTPLPPARSLMVSVATLKFSVLVSKGLSAVAGSSRSTRTPAAIGM